MLISKKELLAQTGISYGQLYRWKRERLIPEEWFMKQSSYTGQETFFPKEQILNRIKMIQELKDNYSLEELAKMLSPESTEVGFDLEDLKEIEEINSDMLPIFQTILDKKTYSYIDVLMFVILSKLKEELNLNEKQTGTLLEGLKMHLEGMKTTDYILIIFNQETNYFAVISQEQSPIYLDTRFEIVKKIRMNEVSNQIKFKYSKVFNSDMENKNGDSSKGASDPSYSDRQASSEGENNRSNSKKKENEDIFLKFNNWEVRL
ncbi:YhbD family protein [Anaerocolumna aminovalerica]|uniref:DUF4004 domain-containing protein n=1 Tax=Anaerocolumna aminovalerica TaxID=1527 RepID=A0A1I5EVT4_9FIRM|nr:DUF4004 family protein [Anaerocolumna aminovalerica]SFO15625.1 Protein of unknown function [Anaerocolumna aminovalerica]